MDKIKVQEIKDDAIISIKVNKAFYMMCKASLFTLFKDIHDLKEDPETFVKNVASKPYAELGDKERIFHTITLLVSEIEKQALEGNYIIEKEVSKEDITKDADANVEKSNED
tara:strand:+ start:298 stop:633 length:336 start_codon:yes stop_codon:yes gene_type:complete